MSPSLNSEAEYGAAWDRENTLRTLECERLRSVAAGLAQSLGQSHPDTLAADYALHAHVAKHPSSGTVDVHTLELVSICLHFLGEDSPTTIGARVLWAHEATELMAGTGDGEPARTLASMAGRQTSLLGPAHPLTLSLRRAHLQQATRAYKLDASRELDDYPRAPKLIAAWTALFDEHVAALGADHPDTMTCRESQAAEHCEFGLHDGEARCYAALVADSTRVHGPDHLSTLQARDMRCTSLAETGRPHNLEVSRTLRTALVADCLRILGRSHLLTQSVLNL
ncbi:hypothetical protein OOK29_23945 [Streptomyces phaeochromogenes]|uniref:hypothetical protein n=1 Tax=Streptomyces phaeochromogenes TaxID=1923 RepID=UPI00224FA9AF|nr:hypothetical protein [Streptomyces phaeochromogenes]MCX5601204.1 hypothetical protein [Streptomyces phaeochromogenes]